MKLFERIGGFLGKKSEPDPIDENRIFNAQLGFLYAYHRHIEIPCEVRSFSFDVTDAQNPKALFLVQDMHGNIRSVDGKLPIPVVKSLMAVAYQIHNPESVARQTEDYRLHQGY